MKLVFENGEWFWYGTNSHNKNFCYGPFNTKKAAMRWRRTN